MAFPDALTRIPLWYALSVKTLRDVVTAGAAGDGRWHAVTSAKLTTRTDAVFLTHASDFPSAARAVEEPALGLALVLWPFI